MTIKKKIVHALVAAVMFFAASSAMASQGSGCIPTSGTLSGLTLVQDINAANNAFISMNSGATAPATACSGVPLLGQVWLDTNTNTVKVFDGASWLVIGTLDTTSHVWNPVVGGGVATTAAATSTDLGAISAGFITISGNTTIAGFSNTAAPGSIKLLKFTGTPTLTNSANLILPGAADILVVAGDQAVAIYVGGGAWSVIYQRADGTSVSTSSIFTGSVFFNSQITPTTISGNSNDWAPTGLSTANVIRLSASAAFNITGITAPVTNGKVIDLQNIGSFNVTLTAQDTGSAAGNRFAIPRPIVLRPGQSLAIIYDLTAARWREFVEISSQPIAGGFKALKITNNGAAPLTTMDITADQLTVEDVNGRAARLSAVSVSPVMTSSGANGLDTGSIVNNVITWYFEYVIFNPTTNTVAGLYSIQSTCAAIFAAPSMPSGYTFCARVGAVRTDGAATARWMGIIQYGRSAQYVVGLARTTVLPVMANGNLGVYSPTAPSWSPIAVANFVPTTASKIRVVGIPEWKGASLSNIQVAPNNSYGGAQNSSGNVPPLDNGNTGTRAVAFAEMILESANIYYAANASGSGLVADGWDDNL